VALSNFFVHLCRFWVRQELLFEFLKHWVSREAQLQQQEGFLGLQVCGKGRVVYATPPDSHVSACAAT
jgi:hypothetical protein